MAATAEDRRAKYSVMRAFCVSRPFAWVSTCVIELMIFIDALRNPVSGLAAIQFALLAAPLLILVLAIRSGDYGAVFNRVITVFIIATVLDLFYLR